eukprot:TRINITY_DN43710_c0_g1_i1.p1 TRINITY_DN43710_c0_g1~~TRINITY_DN43710_c0_g1_i1.p1  ORF type:complete len:934 (-),score=165.54 TRINITY_DN43710_c0_g1_i1:85-2691(-)
MAISILFHRLTHALFFVVVFAGLFVSVARITALQASEMNEAAYIPRHRSDGVAFLDASGVSQSSVAPREVPDSPGKLETFTVVLPCAYEGEFAEKTIRGLLENTDKSRLVEIIVVDDGSQPKLILPDDLLRDEPGRAAVRVIRHEKTVGLIGAKKAGGDKASGDVITFFDCHVLPRRGWEEAFLKQMNRAGDHRTVVVPTITSLDLETWKELPSGPSSKACIVMPNADFTWLSDSGRDVPLMSGGLLALSRRWWEETEGYDEHMVAWGGENIDQSVRTWVCGGRIEAADGAYVAHMWRDAKNPKTRLKYPIPTREVMRNKARAVSAWFDGFKDKVFTFPEYKQFTDGTSQIGDLSNFDRVRNKLQCRPFSHYVSRFSYIYLEAGVIPPEVFQIREEKSNLCLQRMPTTSPPHKTVLMPCAGDDGEDRPGGVKELQLWHLANKDRANKDVPCCSGINNWNNMQCIDAQGVGAQLRTYECTLGGHSPNQLFRLEDGAIIYRPHPRKRMSSGGEGCVAPMKEGLGEALYTTAAASKTTVISSSGGKMVRAKDGSTNPASIRLTASTNNGSGSGICATSDALSDLKEGPGWTLTFSACEPTDAQQDLKLVPLLDGFQVHVGLTKMCLDYAGGAKPLVYPCYEPKVANRNQVWEVRDGKHLCWKGNDNCIDVKPMPKKSEAKPGLSLQTCSSKRGQRFRKHDIQGEAFRLRDEDTGKCLQQAAFGSREAVLGDCDGFGWTLTASGQLKVQSKARGEMCLSHRSTTDVVGIAACNDMKFQWWKVKDDGEQAWIATVVYFEDNGRKRYHEKCIDYDPKAETELSVQTCNEVRNRGIRWSKFKPHVPIERKWWESEGPKIPADMQVLGGSSAPPWN